MVAQMWFDNSPLKSSHESRPMASMISNIHSILKRIRKGHWYWLNALDLHRGKWFWFYSPWKQQVLFFLRLHIYGFSPRKSSLSLFSCECLLLIFQPQLQITSWEKPPHCITRSFHSLSPSSHYSIFQWHVLFLHSTFHIFKSMYVCLFPSVYHPRLKALWGLQTCVFVHHSYPVPSRVTGTENILTQCLRRQCGPVIKNKGPGVTGPGMNPGLPVIS